MKIRTIFFRKILFIEKYYFCLQKKEEEIFILIFSDIKRRIIEFIFVSGTGKESKRERGRGRRKNEE